MKDDGNDQLGHVRQRKLKRELPDALLPPRDIPKPPKQATGYLTIRQAKGGHYAVGVIGDTQSSTEHVTGLNDLLTFVGDWASGQYNEVKE